MIRKPRRTYLIDLRVQGSLVVRSFLYWLLCLLTIATALLCWRIFTGPARVFYTHFDDLWFHYGPVALASLLLLPLVIVDTIRLSNRFAGPIFRLRRVMQELADGQHVAPIKFRDGDYWQEMAGDFNRIAARLQALERERGEASELVGSGA